MMLSHEQAKSSTGSWKANECLKLDAPEVANLNIPLLSFPSNAQLVSFFWRSTKALLWKGTGMIIFRRWMPKIYFFSAAESEQILFGGWTGSCAAGDKKAQNGSSVGLHAVPHTMPERLKNKKGMPVTEILKICPR